MLLENMTRQACIELLARTKLGRLACVSAGQPYVTPFSFVHDSNRLYSFSAVGQKITWMRANPQVCVQADEVFSRQNWASVIATGRYEELPDTPEHSADREQAYELIGKTPLWWEPAYVKRLDERALETIYFAIHVDQISGRRAASDGAPEQRRGWMQKIFGGSEPRS